MVCMKVRTEIRMEATGSHDHFPSARFAALVSAAALFLCSAVIQAHSQEVNALVDYVEIQCKPADGLVRIEKHTDIKPSDVPSGASVRRLDQMFASKPLAHDDSVMVPVNDLNETCKLGGASYAVRVRAHSLAVDTMQGACGADGPSAEIDVLRNRSVILRSFVMHDQCREPDAWPLDVSSVSLSEPTQSAIFAASIQQGSGVAALPFTMTYSFSKLKSVTFHDVWAGRAKGGNR